ncbi:MAG: diguanylate cyclase [Gallionella sp.]
MTFISYLQRMSLWQLRLFATVASVLLSELIILGVTWLLQVPPKAYLLVGLVTSSVVSYAVLTVITHLLAQLTTNQLELNTIIEAEPECVKLLTADGAVLQINRAGLDMLEVAHSEELIGRVVYDFVLAPYRANFIELTRSVFAGKSGNLEFEIQGRHGTRRWLHTHAVPLRNAKGDIIALLAVTRDMTERRQIEDALRISHDNIELLLNSMAEGVYGVDDQGNCTFVNRSFLRMLGYQDRSEVVGKHIHSLIHHTRIDGTPYPAAECRIYRAFQFQEEINVSDEVFWRKDGVAIPVEYWSHPLLQEGSIKGAIATFIDITERKAAEQQIRQLAYYDTLTQLPNRRLLNDRLDQAMLCGERNGHDGALMFLDLDNFKPLNDRYGHDVGDLLLVEVAQRLNTCIRKTDTVARFGGDEFVVMIGELTDDKPLSMTHAAFVAEKICQTLAAPYRLRIAQKEGDAFWVEHLCTASIGVVLFRGHQSSHEDVLKWADMAMYQAKEKGRNTYHIYEPILSLRAEK